MADLAVIQGERNLSVDDVWCALADLLDELMPQVILDERAIDQGLLTLQVLHRNARPRQRTGA